MKKEAVVVTTEHKGVFFGYVQTKLTDGTIVLTQARNCVYWSADVKGFMGLAATGPSSGCRVGPPVPKITLVKVTSVIELEPTAVTAWEKAPWSR